MLRSSLLLLLCRLFLATAYGAIDLTPAVTDVVDDDVTYREVSFKTPGGKMLFTLPPSWTIRGQKDRAQMTGPDKSSADAFVEAITLEKPAPLDEAAVTKFKQQVLAGLPAGSAKITTVSEAQNSLMPGGYPSFEFVISYDLWGKGYQRSALLVNGPQDRLVFCFTCLKSDFAALNTHFRRSLMTWHAAPNKATAPAPAEIASK
jgi:hypothetical protein